MSRERMVTRTINITEVSVICLEVSTAEVTIKNYDMNGIFTEVEALKALKKKYETNNFKLVHVEKISMNELLYGMSEEDFIRFATILPPRNTNK